MFFEGYVCDGKNKQAYLHHLYCEGSRANNVNDYCSFHTSKNIVWAERNERLALSPYSNVLYHLYRIPVLRKLVIRLCRKLEAGDCFSVTLRHLFRDYHHIEIGKYSYGCFIPGVLPPGVSIGNYCSIAGELCVLRRNHPYRRLSQHPFFFNKHLGLVDADTIEEHQDNPLKIGNDVWIGQRVTILPGCREIGDGAIIGAGSVVTKDVSPFTVVGGSPAKVICDRFDDGTKQELMRIKWWDRPIKSLLQTGFQFTDEIDMNTLSKLTLVRSETEEYIAGEPVYKNNI